MIFLLVKTEIKSSSLERKMKGHGILLFPMPFQGHINPMLQLANILHAKGFSITIIHTQFNSPNPKNYPHFRFCSIPDGLSENQTVPSDLNDIITLLTTLNSNCVTPFTDCLAKLLYANLEDRIDCLVTDALWYCTQSVADGLKLPRIVLRTSNVVSFRVFISLSFLQEKGYFTVQGTDHLSSF